jgi:hypothetical protein
LRGRFRSRFGNNWGFWSALWVASSRFLRDLRLGFSLVLVGFFFLLVVSEFVFDISWGRNEGAGGGVLGNPVSTIAALGGLFRNHISRSVPAQAVQSIHVQLFIP